jgi:hypothetical protein
MTSSSSSSSPQMSTTISSYKRFITAILDGIDGDAAPNQIHTTKGSREFGFEKPLVGGTTVFAWAVDLIVDVLGGCIFRPHRH